MAEDEFGDFEAAPSVAAATNAQEPVRAAVPSGVKGLAAPLPLGFFDEHEVVAAPHARSWDGVALPARPLHAKGDLVWYSQRDGSWVAAQIVSVDVSVAPPSYGVLVEGRYRETEGHRLCPRTPGQPAPASQVQHTAAQGAAAPASQPQQPPLQQQRGLPHSNGAHLAAPSGSGIVCPTFSGSPAYSLVVARQEARSLFASEPAGQPSLRPSPAPAGAGAAADDDFGDFESAAPVLTVSASQPVRAAVPPRQPQQQGAPQQAAGAAAVAQPPPLAGQPPLQGPLLSSNGFALGMAGTATLPAAAAAAASGAADSSGLWQRWQQRQARSRQGSPDSLHRQQQQQQRMHGQAGQVLGLPQSPPPSPPKKPLTLQLPQQEAHLMQQQQQPSPYQQQQPSPYSTPPRSPMSPRASSGQAAVAAQSPLGSPRRSSPAVDRFHSFLRFAAPHAAQRIESQDQEAAAAAAGSSGVDEWGDFGGFAAGSSPGATGDGLAVSPTGAAHMKGPQLGHGVDRGAPLPLDIFGEEEAPQEDPPMAPLSQASISPTVAGCAAAAAAPFGSAPPASPRSQQGGTTWEQRQQQQQQHAETVVAAGEGRGQQGLQVPPAASVTGAAVSAAAATAAAAASCAPPAALGSGAADGWGEDSFGEFVDADPGSEAPEGHQPWFPSAAAAPAAWPAADPATQLAGSASIANGSLGTGAPPPARPATFGGERDLAAAAVLDGGAAGMPSVNGTHELSEAHASEAIWLGGQKQTHAAGGSLPLPAPADSHGTRSSPSEAGAATAGGDAAAAELAFEDWGSLDAAEAAVWSVSNSPIDEPGSPAQGDGFPLPALVEPLEPQQEVPAAATAAVVAVAALGRPQPSQAGAPLAGAGQWEEAVTEYGVAWVRLLEAAARELECGQRLWREALESGSAGALLAADAAQRYLASLGQVFLAAAVVQVAARLLGLYGLVGELQQAWGRCEAAWTAPAQPAGAQEHVDAAADTVAADTIMGLKAEAGAGQAAESEDIETAERPLGPGLSFQEAVLASSRSVLGPTAGSSPSSHQQQQQQQEERQEGEAQQEGPQQAVGLEAQLGALQQAEAGAPGLSLDAFPRMLEWSEGLDGLTLLPLCLLEGAVPVAGHASWLRGRPVLVPVANLWAGCLPRVLPDLD